MTEMQTYLETLQRHLEAEAYGDDEAGEHAQRAKWLLDHIGAVSDPATLDRQILAALGVISAGLRQAEAWAQDRARS